MDVSHPGPSRLAAMTLAAAVAAAGCGGGPSASVRPASEPRFRAAELPRARSAPDFALRDQDGRTVRLSRLRGKVVLVAFLYTRCPDVCPLIADNLNQALRKLREDRRAARVLAVSVDPKGDTEAAVRTYVRNHHLLPEFRYLTGTRRELEPVWRAFHIAAVARDAELVDHSAYVALIDRNGRERAHYDAQVRASDVVADVRLLLRENHG
ncbi:MAG: SCO family protein [Actinomycetota bacterium]|nr:SCO family protein [Actinomycetota bacterium]